MRVDLFIIISAGAILSQNETAVSIQAGLELLKSVVGESAFGGRGKKYLVTDSMSTVGCNNSECMPLLLHCCPQFADA